MKKLLLVICLMLVSMLIGCGEVSSLKSSLTSSVGTVTDMHTTYPVGSVLVIGITPNEKAEAGKYYAVYISYLKRGRLRTAVGWTELEIKIGKAKNVYMPLTQGEASTLYKEPESKLREVFGVTIEPTPMDSDTLKEMQKQGIIKIYQ